MPANGYPRERSKEVSRIPLKVRLGSFVAEIFAWGFIDASSWRNYLHTHSFYEICYAFAGRGQFRMHGVVHEVKAGDVFIARPHEEHEIISSDEQPLGIHFWSHSLIPEAATSGTPDEAVDRLLHAFADSRRCVSNRVPGMDQTIALMIEETARAEPGYVEVLEGLARKLLLDTARASLDKPMAAGPLPLRTSQFTPLVVDTTRTYVRDNLARELSVRDLAAQVNLSERHFARIFQAASGRSPLDFIIDCRVAAAEQLLLAGEFSIKEIARRVGYPDVRYFTTVFRRRTGFPPATWRMGSGTKLKEYTGDMGKFTEVADSLRRLQQTMEDRSRRNQSKGKGRRHGRKSNKRGPSSK